MTNNNPIQNFTVKALLSDPNHYSVPMYQRNYAWGEAEINQLIQDIVDHQANQPKQRYYIGTLVVFERDDGCFEVIDGQQRLTTLTLLTLVLKRLAVKNQVGVDMSWFEAPNLDFESRPKSSATLTSLTQRVGLEHLKTDDYNQEVINGYELLEKGVLALDDQLEIFCEHLFEQVAIARVSVPKDTDLNHYFEVMNNRGEQLEKHEVVKARLMSVLTNDKDKALFSKIWDATANMERYVQYGFSPAERHRIFGKNNWGQFTPIDYTELAASLTEVDPQGAEQKHHVCMTFNKILTQPPQLLSQDNKRDDTVRFNSVINFSNFLLHVLSVSTKCRVVLDDKRLLERFEEYVKAHDKDKVTAVQDFAYALLKCKYLFDQYIIKREFNDKQDKWSLKRLHFYNETTQSYINTFYDSKGQDEEDDFAGNNRKILMLLSALHVSTPTSANKYWLNGALFHLFSMDEITSHLYLEKLERLARQFVYGRFLSVEPASYHDIIYKNLGYSRLALDPSLDLGSSQLKPLFDYGKIDNNLVFNYLDYLLWSAAWSKAEEQTKDAVITQFEFTFRSSVEHFYPQHPINKDDKLDVENLHRFGNLCLISHSKNSKLSNILPKGKGDHFRVAIANNSIDTLKLYEMIKLMDKKQVWTATEILDHEKDMLKILSDDSTIGCKK